MGTSLLEGVPGMEEGEVTVASMVGRESRVEVMRASVGVGAH